MHRNPKNKITITINQPNERIYTTYNNTKKESKTNSAYSLHSSNTNNGPKDYRINTNNKYSICNTSPNTKISKHLNLTRTIQSIPRSSHSKEGIISSKFVHRNNVLSSVRTNSNNRIYSTNKSNNTPTINNYTNRSQTINYPLTENVQKGRYQRISIANNTNTNNRNYTNANLNNVRISHRPYGIIQAYATITSSGKRTYNEDRVSIIYNIPKPSGYSENKKNVPWPNCSFFGLYDGHGGSKACDFLRDNLHKFIINDKYFPSNPQKAIANGFIYAEKLFFKKYTGIDSSGSCAIVILIIENRVYIVNVGDSRAILSAKNGTKFYPLSRDHRPGDEKEYKRILDAGGKIYKTEYEYGNKNTNSNAYNNRKTYNNYRNNNNISTNNRIIISNNKNSSVVGPLRVSPGKLSVSRTIGDIEAKDPKFGGNPNVIISIPEIKYFDNTDKNDFILIFCDGVYEKLKNQDIIDCIWKEIKTKKFADIHNMAGYTIEKLINKCIQQDSSDNLTAIMICLKSYDKLKVSETPIPQTENIDQSKTKKLNLVANINSNNKIRSQSKKPLSMLLTKLIHNNSQNIKKVINLKSKDSKDNKINQYRQNTQHNTQYNPNNQYKQYSHNTQYRQNTQYTTQLNQNQNNQYSHNNPYGQNTQYSHKTQYTQYRRK
jgi:protein phosphatase 2C family protein 2/3